MQVALPKARRNICSRHPARRKRECGKQIGSYVGLIPCEDSSAGHQRLGDITKQGSSLLRFLLGEAAQAAARCDSDWRRRYIHLAMRRQSNIAKVAMARRPSFCKLGALHYWP